MDNRAAPLLAIPIAAIGAAIVVAHVLSQSWLDTIALSILAALLTAVAAADLREFRIPDGLSLAIVLTGLSFNSCRTFALGNSLVDASAVIGAIAGPAALYLVRAIYFRARGRHGLGLGDVKLAAGAGAWVGVARLPECLLLACVLALVGLMLMMWCQGRDQLSRTTMLPFGAAMAPAIWVVAAIGLTGSEGLG